MPPYPFLLPLPGRDSPKPALAPQFVSYNLGAEDNLENGLTVPPFRVLVMTCDTLCQAAYPMPGPGEWHQMLAVIAFLGTVRKECWPWYRGIRSSAQAGHGLECDLEGALSFLQISLSCHMELLPLSCVPRALKLDCYCCCCCYYFYCITASISTSYDNPLLCWPPLQRAEIMNPST